MNSAARTFALVGLVAAILLAMHMLPTIHVNGQELRAVNILSDILPEPYQQKYSIDVIPRPDPPKPMEPVDSMAAKPFVEYRPEGVTLIDDYSEGLPGGMDHFYGALDSLSVLQRPLRIAYFGDSFVEGDILTAHIRERLQQRFGGSGVGWADPGNKINGFRQTVRQRFKGFREYEVVEKPFDYRCQGINQRYFVPEEGASVWTRGTDYCPHAADWQQATLFLRADQAVTVEVNIDDTGEWTAYQLEGSDRLQSIEIRRPMHSVSYRFRDIGQGTYVHGMALEDTTGITLDNFSMRGSSGLTLSRLPADLLADLARQRTYDLIVLHFGLNVVSERTHAANYKAHIRRMADVVALMRQTYPQASVLVVSVPDRDQRTPAGIRTMNGVESLVGYQQLLASDCHVAFFNLFQAMGGRESMKQLVDRQLANKDYTHLKHKGGEELSKPFFDSLMAGYENYHRRKGYE